MKIRLSAYTQGKRRHGKLRFASCNGKTLAYRRVSGGKPGKKYYYWLIYGLLKRLGTKSSANQHWIVLIPIQTAEERTVIRRELGVIARGPMAFL